MGFFCHNYCSVSRDVIGITQAYQVGAGAAWLAVIIYLSVIFIKECTASLSRRDT